MIFYLDNNNEWKMSDNDTVKHIENLFQRIQTFKYEQPFDQYNGIDYLSVIRGQVDISSELDVILQDFKQYFQSIEYDTPTQVGDVLQIKISIVLNSGETVTRDIFIGGN